MKENRSARVREKQQRSDRAQRRSVSVNSNGIQMPAEPDEKIAFCENARDKQEHMSSSLQNNGTENSPSCSDSCELSIVKTSPQHDLSRTSPSSTSKVMPTPLFAKQFDVQNEEYFPVSSNLVTTNSVGVEDNAIIETLRKDDTAVKSVSVTSEPLSSHTPCNQSPPLKFPKLSVSDKARIYHSLKIPKPPAIPQRKLISGKPNSQENVFSEITSTKVESAQKSIKMKISLKEKSLSFSCSDKSPVNTMDTALGVPPIQSVNKDCRETGNALMDSELREELSSEQCIEQEKSFSNKVVEDPHIEIDSLENKSKEIAEDFQMDIGATENKLEEESSCMGEMNNCFQKSVTGVSGYNCSTTEQSCSIQNNQKRIRPIRDHGFARGLSVSQRFYNFIRFLNYLVLELFPFRSNILFAIVQFKNCDVVEVISVKVIQHYEPKVSPIGAGTSTFCISNENCSIGEVCVYSPTVKNNVCVLSEVTKLVVGDIPRSNGVAVGNTVSESSIVLASKDEQQLSLNHGNLLSNSISNQNSFLVIMKSLFYFFHHLRRIHRNIYIYTVLSSLTEYLVID
uniref:PHD-type domain-containing protein n=1 Tax=Heterorhabditis bacteriophora TaxID=37862 RepID=A0A1I7WXZ0_HETBA